MPIYEYECHLCGHRLEKLQKISDQPLTDCPACEQSGLKKLVSAVAFRLSGSGWYETDFKDEKSRRNLAKQDDKAGESDSAKTTEGKDKSKDKDKEAKTDSSSAGKETKSATQSSGAPAPASPPAG